MQLHEGTGKLLLAAAHLPRRLCVPVHVYVQVTMRGSVCVYGCVCLCVHVTLCE